MSEGFRIQSIIIEGFKGFTTPQEFELNGGHAFLLGQNGNGKSSIIEAVRWGLFGSTNRPNEIVANRAYTGDCRVSLKLTSGGRQWELRREYRRGVGHASRAEMFDESGAWADMSKVMPQLDSVDAGEGMHIIFASQSAPLSRQPHDLSAFGRAILSYVGLTHPNALLSRLESFVIEQEQAEDDLDKKLTEQEDQQERSIADLLQRRSTILNSAPWGNTSSPTQGESEGKARKLLENITARPADDTLDGASLDALLAHVDGVLKASERERDIADELAAADKHLNDLQAIMEAHEKAELLSADLGGARSRLADVLQEDSIDGLRGRIDELRATVDAEELKGRIVEYASDFLSRQTDDPVLCPVCNASCPRQEIETTLRGFDQQSPKEAMAELHRLQTQLSEAAQQERETQRLALELEQQEAARAIALQTLNSSHPGELPGDPDQLTLAALDAAISRCSDQAASIRAQLENREGWLREKSRELANLREEWRYHQINAQLTRRQRAQTRLSEVKAAYKDLTSFGQSLRSIRDKAKISFSVQLEQKLPGVEAKLSQAFAALTDHPYFDQVVIDRDKLPRMELRVSSSQEPPGQGHPTAVLNGQAESALTLAPYFAFSQADESPTEVYLVMLDDPTRAFDGEHIGILVKCLAEIGQNVQLMVGSQETDRFRQLLPQHFASGDCLIIKPHSWSYQGGPQIKIERP